MTARQSFSCLHLLKALIAVGLLVSVVSCGSLKRTYVKKYQPNKPFVFKTNINVIGNFTNARRKALKEGLEGQLDDSMRVRRLDKFFWDVQKNPPVYDSINAAKSIQFMRALLVSLGYFNDSIGFSDTVVKYRDQLRTTITFDVKPRQQWRLDSISYNIQHPELQLLADTSKRNAFIKKGDPFAKLPISAELDRLTELYRNSGYFRFSRDELIGVWDTLDVSLLQPSLDPFEQLELLQKLRERRQNPTANLELRLKDPDSARLTKFYNGNVTIYPDYSAENSSLQPTDTTIVKGIKVIQYKNTFNPRIFPSNIYLPHDSVYRLRRYLRTVNRFNLLGAWQLVNVEPRPRDGQDTIDYIIRLTPEDKYLFTTQLEGSFNQNALSGNLFGISVNASVQNRNFLKGANNATTNFRYGIEFSDQNGWSNAAKGTMMGIVAGGATGAMIHKKKRILGGMFGVVTGGTSGFLVGRSLDDKKGRAGTSQFIQSKNISISHTILFPRAILFENWFPENRKDNFRTIFSVNAANTERRLLYNLTTLNASWGYEYQRRQLLINVKFPIPNIEYSFLNRRDSLDSLIKYNPTLRNIFTDGLIVSHVASLTLTGGRKNNVNILRANFEGAPLVAGWIRSPFLDSQLYRFLKFDVELARLIRYKKSSIALRAFMGVGIADPFNSTVSSTKRNALPFFKQFFAGGPSSMRAWSLRRLGPGSTIQEFTSTPDRYGDMHLEANAEFRFPIMRVLGVPINGALFTDVGNVWFWKKAAGTPEQVFDINRLGKDIAVGAGTGLRINFGFLTIRLDYAYKVKDPSPAPEDAALQNKWFGYPFFKGDQFQLGIGYPFISD